MPLYEYKCQSCGKKEERLEKVEAPTKHDCLFCNTALGMHRQVSLTSFVLTGGGWMAHGYEDKKKSSEKQSSQQPNNIVEPTTPTVSKCTPVKATPAATKSDGNND